MIQALGLTAADSVPSYLDLRFEWSKAAVANWARIAPNPAEFSKKVHPTIQPDSPHFAFNNLKQKAAPGLTTGLLSESHLWLQLLPLGLLGRMMIGRPLEPWPPLEPPDPCGRLPPPPA